MVPASTEGHVDMAHAPTISAGALRKLLAYGQEQGLDPALTCERAGVPGAHTAAPDTRIPIRALHALWEQVLERTGRWDGALVGAQRYVPGDYELMGVVAMNSATLGEALAHVARYSRLWVDDPVMELKDGSRMVFRYRTEQQDRPGLRLATEAGLAEVLHGARMVTQDMDLAPVEVLIPHAAPPDRSAHDAYFKAPVKFGTGQCVLVMGAQALEARLPRADPQLGAYLKGLAQDALARRGDDASLMEQLRRMIAEELQKGLPGLEVLARRLAMSERTLRRRLDEEGTTFRDVLDDVRCELARNYVRDRRFTLAEVAFLLGFSEQSTFQRAFKRWTGTTPAAFREQRLSAASGTPA